MEWVAIINDLDGYGKAYQLWSPAYPAVRANGSNVPRRCAGLVHRIGESVMWRARVSGSPHITEFESKDEAMRWIETQAKLMGFT